MKFRNLELVSEGTTSLLRESEKSKRELPKPQERLQDPEYLKFLGTLEQEYINPDLGGGPQILKDVAVLSIDYEGFTRFARSLTEIVDQPKYASREMARHMSLGLNEAREIIRAYVGMMNGVFGDGTGAVFAGEKAVQRAILAARAIEEKVRQIQAIPCAGD